MESSFSAEAAPFRLQRHQPTMNAGVHSHTSLRNHLSRFSAQQPQTYVATQEIASPL